MRGQIKLPLDKGRKELCWQIGRAIVQGSNLLSPVVDLRINRDADFVARRLWLVMAPYATGNWSMGREYVQAGGFLPADAAVKISYGGAGNLRLSLIPGLSRSMMFTMDPKQAPVVMAGLPSPFLMRANTVLYAEITCPSRAGTVWPGDLYLVAEGYKIFPLEPEPIPRTVEAYSVPYWLNGTIALVDPTTVASGYIEQTLTITNDGEGKFLAKGLMITPQVPVGSEDLAMGFLSMLGVQIEDTTSGSKPWVQDSTPDAGTVRCPAGIMTGNYCNIPFNTPRIIDENAVLKVKFVMEPWQTWPGPFTFPMNVTVSLFGSMLPRGMA